jgi:hypothetical protein
LTKLDPYRAYITERLGSASPEWIPASVLLMELRERGYCGGYTMLKLFMASLRPKQAVEPVIRFETEPGEQMQVDWAVIRRGSNRLSVFVATLGWSRATYVEFVTDERVETLIEAHENAFLAFGGTPRQVPMTTCAPWCWSGTATVAVDTVSMPAFSTSPATAVSGLGCVRRIGRRPRARSSVLSAICDTASTCRWPAGWPMRG